MSSNGGAAGSGNIDVNDAVNWSANTLTLTAANNINIDAVMTAGGSAALVLNTAAANGADAGVAGGAVNAMPGVGRVDFAGRSGTGFLTINGNGYTVLNSLGVQGDATGGAATLQGMAATANLAGHYALGSDIDASATSGWNTSGGVSAGFEPIGNSSTSFTGSFDGLGHTISGMTINRPTLDRVGLFGSAVDPEIRNVGLTSVNITGHDLVGGLAGYKYGGSVSNSYAAGRVVGGLYTAGLVGANDGSISNSYAAVAVSGNFGTGGLVGYNRGSIDHSYATGQVFGSDWYTGGLVGGNAGSGSVSNSYATGDVHGGNSAAGGLVGGSVDTSSISNSYATGDVSSDVHDVGGLVGGSYANISNSYATGQVSGSTVNVGGLVGIQYSGSISQSYATGAVSGPNAGGTVGGLVGRQDGGTVSASYWNTQTTGQSHSTGSADTFGLTSAEMMDAGSFAGWDLATAGGSNAVWRIYEGHTAPLLRTLMTNLVVTAGNAAKTYDGAAYAGGNGVTYSRQPDSNLLGAPSYGGTSQGAKNVGRYVIVPSGYWSNQQGYDIAYANGALTVNPATLTFTADPAGRPYGVGNPPLSGSVSGFVGGDTLANATTGVLAWNSVATANSPAGWYAIDGSGLSAANYIFVQAPGNARALTVLSLDTESWPAAGVVASLQADSDPDSEPLHVLPAPTTGPAPVLFSIVGSGVRLP